MLRVKKQRVKGVAIEPKIAQLSDTVRDIHDFARHGVMICSLIQESNRVHVQR